MVHRVSRQQQQRQHSPMRKRGALMSQESSLRLPENLGARCALLYAWDEDYTVRALEGYLQFMELKVNFEDWDCEQLAPSVVIDLVWQQHLLYNKQYNQACTDYCGNIIGYDPDSSLISDNPAHEQKIKTTKIALKALFGRAYDADVWNFLFGSSGMNKKGDTGMSSQEKNNMRGIRTTISEADDTVNTHVSSKATMRSKTQQLSKQPVPPVQSSSLTPNYIRYDSREDHEATRNGQNNRTIGSNGSIHRDETLSDSELSDFRMAASSSQQQQPQQQPQQQQQRNRAPTPAAAAPNRLPSSHKQSAATSKSSGGKNGSSTPSESVTVKVKCFIDGKTQDTCIRVKRTTRMKKVEDCLAKLMHLDSAESLRFLVDGEQVSPWETLESMKVDDPEQHWFTVMPKVSAFH